jgi:hypothetical protein
MTEIKEDPIFIIGHWRTGTTHLQNLMLKDNSFSYLNLVEATFPHLILGSYKLIRTLMKPLIPDKRPMDNMEMSAETPQEHEFVLTNFCLLSPLTALFFPSERIKYMKYGSFEEATEKEKEIWKRNLLYFLQKLTLMKEGKRLLLKNPLDTFRIKLILELFPNAKFINIYRNPYEVFFSTVKLHKTNTSLFWLQKPNYELYDFVFDMYTRMYKQFYKDFELIPEENIIEVKYENLIADPLNELEGIYEYLKLGDFKSIKSLIVEYLDSISGYEVGKYHISEKDFKRIYTNWHATINRWNYKKHYSE